jgi:tRNA-binding protein
MAPRLPDVTPDAFAALDLRVGRVVDVQPFPEARRPAWKLFVDFGPDVGALQTSAQVTSYRADELVGRLVMGAINLGTKRIAGFRSEFLLLGAVDPTGGLVHLPDLPDAVEPGWPVR